MDAMTTVNSYLLAGGALVLAGIASSLLARRFGAPLLLVFLVLGMLLGEDGPGGIAFDNYRAAYLVGSLALAVILFDGGLRTRLSEVGSALTPSILLASIGVVVTAGLTGLAAMFLFDLAPAQGLLLGAIVASTDAAAVFFLLRAGGLHLRRRVGATLEVESGSNDPVAVFLTIGLVTWIASQGTTSAAGFAFELVRQAGLGLLFGWLGGRALAFGLNRLALPGGLHPLLALAGAVTVFALTALVGGSGFLAVYLAGLVVGNRPVRAFASVVAVQDASTWLAQLMMFLVLGLLVTPSQLLVTLWPALALSAFLILVARPVAVVLCLLPMGYSKRETGFIAWVGLRGAVGIFLASIPMLVELPNAELYFNVAFVVVISSLLVQGWSLGWLANRLGVALPRRDPPFRRIELDLPGQLEKELVGYRVAPGSAVLRGVEVPGWARPNLVVRGGQALDAGQAGSLRAEDYAYFLAPPDSVERLDWLFAEPGDAREVARDRAGTVRVRADISLRALGGRFHVEVPEELGRLSLADLFAEHFDDAPHVGDRIEVGIATLEVQALAGERVSKVNLILGAPGLLDLALPPGARPGRWRRPRAPR
jgi:cell volume regulation protein A